MATTQAQAEQTERKLRPLYDAVDNGQNKKAVQIADKILKKQGELHCAKTLKAIALLRMGRHEESLVLIKEVKETHPGDQATLQACTMYFRETGDYKKISELYADAAKHYPKNQEILTHLFMAYVRIGDYQKQQQTSALLHKNFPESGPYYCWRVMSILMQAHESKQMEVIQTMYYPLAEKLMEKYFTENEVDAEAEVRLFLMVLDKRTNTEKKLEVLCSSVGEKLKSSDERDSMIVDCLVSLGRLDEATKKLTEMIQDKPDQWAYIRTYVKCQIQRFQNFRERVRQQVERDRESRLEGEKEEEEGEGGNPSTEISEGGEPLTEIGEGGGSGGGGDDAGGTRENGHAEEEGEKGEGKDEVAANAVGDDVKVEESQSTTEQQGEVKEDAENGREGGEEEGGGESDDTRKVTISMEDIIQPLTDARDLFDRLTEEEHRKNIERLPGAHVLRGPLLGRMELLKQVTLCKLEDMDLHLAHPQDMLLDYLSLFGTKSCVFEDLKMFLDVFPEDVVSVVLQHLEEVVANDPVNFDCQDSELKENVGRLRRHTNLLQLQRFKGYHMELDAAGKQGLVDVCRYYYKHGLKLSRNQVPTLNKPCDFYIILASHLKIELYQDTDDVSHLWEAVFMLEYARANGTNHQFMLLLLKLYGHLGATECITVLFQALNIKHLQMDTLAYIPMRYMQAMGTFEYSAQLYRSVLRFFFGASKEISEYIIQAYRNGMFHKIVEFVNLRERLAHSMTFSAVMVDMNYMELVVSVNGFQEAKAFFNREWYHSSPFTSPNLRDYCARLGDSRDLKVFEDWDPTQHRLNDIEAKISFDFEILWIRVRISLLRCLRESQLIAERRKGTSSNPSATRDGGRGREAESGSKSTNPVDRLTIFNERLEDFIKSMELLNQHVGTRLLRQQRSRTLLPVQAPPPCLGFTFLQEQHGNILKRMLKTVEQVAQGASSVEERLKDILKHVETTKSRIAIVPEDLREALQKISSREEGDQISIDGLQHPFDIMTKTKMDLERYVIFVQTMSHLVLLSMCCVEYLCPTPAGEGKKKRRKSKKVDQPIVVGELKSFLQELKSQLETLYHQFAPLPVPPSDDEQLREKLNRLYIGASSVQKSTSSTTTSTGGGKPVSSSLPTTTSSTDEATFSCSASSQEEGGGEASEQPSSGVSGDNTGTVVANDMHFERSVVSKVMGQVLESYNMSFKDVLKVVVTKMDLADALIKQLGVVDT